MFKYACLNNISETGLSKFTSNYEVTENLDEANGILVRSASMHGMEFSDQVLAIARAGAGVNNIPIDEYPRRCINQINQWQKEYETILTEGAKEHTRSHEYASHIMEAIITDVPYQIGGNVLNKGHLITNFPEEACVEVPCLVNGHGINPCYVGALPVQLAAMNMTNINVQLLTIEAAVTKKKDHIYQAAMLDPHTGSELDIDTIKKMVDELIEAHGNYLPKFH